jgi:hypothetical protein
MIKRKRHKDKLYTGRVLDVVQAVWKASGCPWSVRLQEIFRLWLPWIRIRYRLTLEEQEKPLRISASTIDRSLTDKKTAMKRRLYGRTKPGTLLRHKISLRTEFSDVHQAGWIEMDLVSHSGRSGEGEFLQTLNLTDIVSTWTESRAAMGKGEQGIVDRLEEMGQGFPFPLRGLDVDKAASSSTTMSKNTVRSARSTSPAAGPIKKTTTPISSRRTGPMSANSSAGTATIPRKPSRP